MTMITPLTSAISAVKTARTDESLTRSASSMTESQGNGFSKLLNDIVQLDGEAAALEQAMYEGQPVELHQLIIASEKAGIAFELLVETRNRLVEAYQELMRMPV